MSLSLERIERWCRVDKSRCGPRPPIAWRSIDGERPVCAIERRFDSIFPFARFCEEEPGSRNLIEALKIDFPRGGGGFLTLPEGRITSIVREARGMLLGFATGTARA